MSLIPSAVAVVFLAGTAVVVRDLYEDGFSLEHRPVHEGVGGRQAEPGVLPDRLDHGDGADAHHPEDEDGLDGDADLHRHRTSGIAWRYGTPGGRARTSPARRPIDEAS